MLQTTLRRPIYVKFHARLRQTRPKRKLIHVHSDSTMCVTNYALPLCLAEGNATESIKVHRNIYASNWQNHRFTDWGMVTDAEDNIRHFVHDRPMISHVEDNALHFDYGYIWLHQEDNARHFMASAEIASPMTAPPTTALQNNSSCMTWTTIYGNHCLNSGNVTATKLPLNLSLNSGINSTTKLVLSTVNLRANTLVTRKLRSHLRQKLATYFEVSFVKDL